MFRECFFEYAGQSSQPYNLMLCYVSNTTTDFNSGGKFDLKTDTLPRSHETLLYGKDYSAQPLSFDVEFVNIDDNIPLQQMTEIKNWLFGQDGWKTFRLLDDRQDYRLKCIFEPGEDIVDGGGYKGLRCTLKNVSPFWYGEERTITKQRSDFKGATTSHANGWEYYHDDDTTRSWGTCVFDVGDDVCADIEMSPLVTVSVDKSYSTYTGSSQKVVIATSDAPIKDAILNKTASSSRDFWDYPDTSSLGIDISYLESTDNDTIVANTRFATLTSQGHPSQRVVWKIDTSAPSPMLRFVKGTNMCRICNSDTIVSITLRYTPVYRLGAF